MSPPPPITYFKFYIRKTFICIIISNTNNEAPGKFTLFTIVIKILSQTAIKFDCKHSNFEFRWNKILVAPKWI